MRTCFLIELTLQHDRHHTVVCAVFPAADRQITIVPGRAGKQRGASQRAEQQDHQGCKGTLCLSEITHALAVTRLIQSYIRSVIVQNPVSAARSMRNQIQEL